MKSCIEHWEHKLDTLLMWLMSLSGNPRCSMSSRQTSVTSLVWTLAVLYCWDFMVMELHTTKVSNRLPLRPTVGTTLPKRMGKETCLQWYQNTSCVHVVARGGAQWMPSWKSLPGQWKLCWEEIGLHTDMMVGPWMQRMKQAGAPLGIHAALQQASGDWQFYQQVFAFVHLNGDRMCWTCGATSKGSCSYKKWQGC